MEKRNMEDDYRYLRDVGVALDAGSLLGERRGVGIFNMALYWMERTRWREMDDPAIEVVKREGTHIIVFVPFKSIPKGVNYRQTFKPRTMFAHWSHPVELSKAVTPSLHSVELENKHGGFWASDIRGIRPIQGSPIKWMYKPEGED